MSSSDHHRSIFLLGTAFLLAGLFFRDPASAQDAPTLVADLQTESFQRAVFRAAGAAADGRFLFWGDDGRRGPELWITDGTPAGTRLWTEVCPGSCAADPLFFQEATPVLFDGERAFFVADDGVHGSELWTSDGTPAGTRLVADLCPGPCGSGIQEPALIGDRLWLSVELESTGREPWTSDGTAEGTVPLGDLRFGSNGSFPKDFLPFGDAVAFQAFTNEHGTEWWRTDGTAEGTARLTDLCPESCSATSANPISIDGALLFSTPSSDAEPLYLLAPGAEPILLGDLCGEPECDNLISFLYPAEDRVYLATEGRLWSTDLTPEGTGPIADLPADAWIVQQIVEAGSGAVLVNIEIKNFQSALWRLDGDQLEGPLVEAAGVLDVAPTSDGALVLTTYGGVELEIYRTDGTVAGTELVDRLPAADSPVLAGPMIRLDDDRVLFRASTSADFFGRDLWRASADGTELVIGTTQRPGTSSPAEMSPLGSSVLFTAQTGGALDFQRALWRIDTSADGPSAPALVHGESHLGDLAPVALDAGERVFFTAFGVSGASGFTSASGVTSFSDVKSFPDLGDGGEAWITDGTAAGTGPLSANGASIVWPREPTVVDGSLIFFGDQGNGQKIWRSDGTAAGTELLVDIDPEWRNIHVGCGICSPPFGPGPIFPRDLAVLADGSLAFVARREESGAEVWHSDGTAEGTTLVADLWPGFVGSDPQHLLAVRDGLLFNADDVNGYRAWWWWPGEDPPVFLADTREVLAAASTLENAAWLESRPSGLYLGTTNGAGLAYFALPDGTVPQGDLVVVAGDRFFFVAADPEAGAELWTADPTSSIDPLHRVADLRPGNPGSFPESLTYAAGTLYFSADDGIHGREPWRLDPTRLPLAPERIADLATGADPSSPRDFAVVTEGSPGGTLYFTADDGIHGREPWSVTATASPTCVADELTHCFQGGRFRVTARWRVPSTGAEGPARAVPAGDESGYFWFFNPENLELVVKVLDGTAINDAYWLFYGALSDVEYWIEAEDLSTGTTRTWHNPPGELCGDADTEAFPEAALPGTTFLGAAFPEPGAAGPASAKSKTDGTGCTTDEDSLCLLDRFRVTVDWATGTASGPGRAVPVTQETGLFWFFNKNNLELMIKILDGRDVNGRFWVYYGALSDVEYTIRVLDTETSTEVIYHNPAGNLCGSADTDAF